MRRLLSVRSRSTFAGCLLAVALTGCEHRDGDQMTVAQLQSENDPLEEVWDARIRTTDDGVPRLQIDAPVMRTYESEDSTYIVLERDSLDERVHVRLFDAEGNVSAVMRANEVVRREDSDLFQARGHVEVVTSDDKRLTAEELRWLEGERVIRSTGFVHIQTPTEDLQGYDFQADEMLDTYRFERVTGRATIREE